MKRLAEGIRKTLDKISLFTEELLSEEYLAHTTGHEPYITTDVPLSEAEGPFHNMMKINFVCVMERLAKAFGIPQNDNLHCCLGPMSNNTPLAIKSSNNVLKIKGLLFFVISYFFLLSTLNAQVHSIPENGATGIPGSIPNSFIIGWKGIEGAIAYEYVLSDNPLCFTGCAGDTRQGVSTDTFAVEYNVESETWYYWITRIIKVQGDTSNWSLISSFFTENPTDNEAKMLSIAPNPIIPPNLNIRMDWAQNPEANNVSMVLYDLNGNIRKRQEFRRSVALRFEELKVNVSDLPSGLYILNANVNGNQNNLNNLFSLRIVIP